jgi:hypothetical protein
VRDVIHWQLGYSTALCPSLCVLIWLLYQSALSSCVLPEYCTPCPSVLLLCSAKLLLQRCDFQSLRSSDSCVVLYHVDFTKQRNAYLRVVSPWKCVYCFHNVTTMLVRNCVVAVTFCFNVSGSHSIIH